ncbi:MAG: 3'-5' exonuclease [Winogradskyella sp.]|nr:3'-5' exonuclease [Winogradskyella sp.]
MLCFFDLETTGINISKDRIVEISIHKVFPDGKEETYTKKVNPTIPIPPETTAVHVILDADVADALTFKELVKWVRNKYRRFRRKHWFFAYKWLREIAKHYPNLFVHWQYGFTP